MCRRRLCPSVGCATERLESVFQEEAVIHCHPVFSHPSFCGLSTHSCDLAFCCLKHNLQRSVGTRDCFRSLQRAVIAHMTRACMVLQVRCQARMGLRQHCYVCVALYRFEESGGHTSRTMTAKQHGDPRALIHKAFDVPFHTGLIWKP